MYSTVSKLHYSCSAVYSTVVHITLHEEETRARVQEEFFGILIYQVQFVKDQEIQMKTQST